MTPIEKNESTIKTVFVVDEQGNKYEATYPKRAKGLVKNGRARFVDEKTICLACPPDKFMEDKIMIIMKDTENKNESVDVKDIAEIANKPEENKLTTREIFDKIAQIQEQLTGSVFLSLNHLGDALANAFGEDEDGRDYSKIPEICRVFTEREANLRSLIELYETMYADVTGKPGKNYTIDYALSQLESIRIEEKEFTSTISGILSGIQLEYPDDVTGQAKVAAVGEMIKAHRENTSRLMDFYTDMIEKIKNSSAK